MSNKIRFGNSSYDIFREEIVHNRTIRQYTKSVSLFPDGERTPACRTNPTELFTVNSVLVCPTLFCEDVADSHGMSNLELLVKLVSYLDTPQNRKFSKFTIYLDMDEVICDFVGGACKILGLNKETLEEFRTRYLTGSQKPFTWEMSEYLNISDAYLWKMIDKVGVEFWTNLEVLETGMDTYNLCCKIADEVVILSSPSNHITCKIGKYLWLSKIFGENFSDCILFKKKYKLANKLSILIDDAPKNINKFLGFGGKGIIYPHRNNQMFYPEYLSKEYVLKYLELNVSLLRESMF